MTNTDILVIGGGPGGLGAAIEAANAGASVMLVDENPRMGGQLYKQIHKFFGSKQHFAGTRGFKIAEELINQAEKLGVKICANTRALGALDDGEVALLNLSKGEKHKIVDAKRIILATGAKENGLAFPGWTLPGVMTAGAAQTFANVHGVLPGQRIVIIGSGNVGLIVAYQLMQAGANVLAIAEVMPKVSGYEVHAAKVRRACVPLYLSHTIVEALGDGHVEKAVIARVDDKFLPIDGTQTEIACDTILLAAGLTPRTDVAAMFGCKMIYEGRLGGIMPLHDVNMSTTNSRVYVCGDLAGVEEASCALDEGRVAGLRAAMDCGYEDGACREKLDALKKRLELLRGGERGKVRLEAKKNITNAMGEYK